MPRLVVVLACLATGTLARAAEPIAYDISARVDAEARFVEGHARIVVPNTTSEEQREIFLWRYPERFATRSPALNDFNFYWVYPYRFNPGHMRTGPILVDGRAAAVEIRDHAEAGKGTLLRVALDPPLEPGARATVDVDFSVTVPKRFGAFGCVHGTCTLRGFYPMVAATQGGGVPGIGSYRLSVAVARVSDVVVNGRLAALEPGRRMQVELGVVPGLTLMVGRPRLLQHERTVRGVHVTLLSADTRGLPSPPEHVLPYQPTDHVDKILNTAEEAINLLAELGAPLPEGTALHIVAGALRIQLAEVLPDVVLISDRLFDIFPLQRFLKFHEFDLARAIYELILQKRLFLVDGPDDLGGTPGAGAAWLVELYTLRSYKKAEFARQILKWASFIPAIDRVMYAPQIPFASSYFYSLEDPDPLRDDLSQFNNTRPTGKTIYTKLVDLLGKDNMAVLGRAELAGARLEQEAERLWGATLDWFWKQWLGPYPKVDYRFASVRSRKLPGGGQRHVAVVVKIGERPPREPVEVRVVDAGGRQASQVWIGDEREHTFTFDTKGRLAVIEIDPRGRLLEDLPRSSDDLKFDDRRPPRWKFIYNNFGGLVRFFPTLGIDLSLDFSLQRILDLRHALRFVVYRSEATVAGVIGSYAYGFGKKITAARLAQSFGVSVSGARIDPSFGLAIGAGANPGTVVSASAGWGYDDRLFVWEPWRALTLGATVGVAETILDNGAVLSQGTASAGWESIWSLADGHGLAVDLSGAITFGDLKIARQMLSAGGANGLRGYDVESMLGRWRAIGRAEWRHVFVHDLNFNLMHSLYLRGLGGGLFVEAGVVSPCGSYTPDKKSLGADVGYTVRVFADWFGVSQTTLNFDFAVPLAQNDRACFGELVSAANRVPFGFFVSFGPPW